MKKKLINLLYVLVWCICTISLFSSFKIERVDINVAKKAKGAIIYATGYLIKLKPVGSKNFINAEFRNRLD